MFGNACVYNKKMNPRGYPSRTQDPGPQQQDQPRLRIPAYIDTKKTFGDAGLTWMLASADHSHALKPIEHYRRGNPPKSRIGSTFEEALNGMK